MLYELHLTTAPDVDVDAWSAVCRALGIKPLVIELERGSHPRQVMLAARTEGDAEHAASWSCDLRDAFTAAGFPILREKLEVPLDKSARFTQPCYHEAHVKLLLSPGAAGIADRIGMRNLPMLAANAGMRLSRNGLATTADGREKWYLTARAYGVDLHGAAKRFGLAFREVSHYLPSVRMEMETVILDTFEGLDDGWGKW